MVKCQKCQREVPEEETHRHLGETLCDDCYIYVMSPAKPCDPWAVYYKVGHRYHAHRCCFT